ncbi:hypothetical protein KFK09_019554 [Dendrobium nobile]|uniref:Integrase catalytic domain-containing protein n=1 Tax=Dendrobium nobile TaxID=94219 RepID=A0A8T3ARK6_DENNO|nr:hypothetical protein KFK09_019554 [Dendrobium nobile]
MWYLDSGCSRHMTGDMKKFILLETKTGGKVTLGDNTTRKVIGSGIVGNAKNFLIENVLLVDGLKHNLLSISQLCDKGFDVKFFTDRCLISLFDEVILEGKRMNNVYMLDLDRVDNSKSFCLKTIVDDSWLWHRRLCHASMKTLRNITQKNLVRGVPKLEFTKDHLCDACQQGKQVKSSFHSIRDVITSRPLEILHMDLFGPVSTASLGGKNYGFVNVDDFTRFTWVRFLAHKNESFEEFKIFITWIQRKLGCEISTIHSDHGGEFQNDRFESFCQEIGIEHNFSAPRTPQQNGIAERKNRTLVEAARAMLAEYTLPRYFWAEAVNTACYVLNRVNIRSKLNKTPYELLKGRTPNLSHLHVFGCKCFILNNGKHPLGKFDPKSDEGVFLGYSSVGKAYRTFNKRTLVVEESTHVVFDESDMPSETKIEDDEIEAIQGVETMTLGERVESQEDLPREWRYSSSHPKELILGDPSEGVRTRHGLRKEVSHSAFISMIEPTSIDQALGDEFWILAMQEELNQFTRNDVWELVKRPKEQSIVGTKWVFKNKVNDS